MMERREFPVERIHVPVKRRRALDPARVQALAEDILENGLTTPIRCRIDRAGAEPRLVLVEGQHRLEAMRALGEATIAGYVVDSQVR